MRANPCGDYWLETFQDTRAKTRSGSPMNLQCTEAAMIYIALQAGHSYRCFSNCKRASFTPRTSCSGRSIHESFTASRDADGNSRASEFPTEQNSASWSRVIDSLRSTPIPSVVASGSVHMPNTSGAFYPGTLLQTLDSRTSPIGDWMCPMSNDCPYPETGAGACFNTRLRA